MFTGKPSFYRNLLIAFATGSCMVWFSSCGVVPKNYPRNKPFVYEYKINLEGNFTPEEKSNLQTRLRNQLDDSIRVRTARKFIYKGINRPVLNKPPVYDPANADKSVVFMRALLSSMGYFKDTITYLAVTDTIALDQFRTKISFNVIPGKPVRLDSISFNIKQPELQKLATGSQKESLLKKGDPFAKSTISLELDRLTDLYRNNGYLKFGRDMLIGLWDTMDVSLLNPNVDLEAYLVMLEKLAEQKNNPTADLEIRLKPGYDNSRLKKYFIGSIKIYPDYNQDTAYYARKAILVNRDSIIYFRYLFKPKIFSPNIYLLHDSLYDQRNYFKTINRFNSFGTWRLVNIEPMPRKNQDTVDFTIRLTPARKYGFSANLEGSINQRSAVSGSLAGISINLGLQNRNLWKSASQSSSSIRFGVETGRDTITHASFFQTRQISFSHSIFFPRPIGIHRILPKKLKENAKTVLSFNAASTERRELFNLTTVNGSWGYEFQWDKNSLALRFPNFEYSNLKSKRLLDTLFKNNPALKYVFTDGFIASKIASFTKTGGKKNNLNLFRSNLEISGHLTGLIKNNTFLDTNLYRFTKLDAEFTRKIAYRQSAIAIRVFAGVGYEFNSTVNSEKKNNLPFFKQYFAGGPNSMRAWALRKLGPGSAIKDFSLDPERYGDVQLEANIEYRFPVANFSGVKLNGALFTDMGNVWFFKKAAGRQPEEVFNVSRLGKDLAIGLGAGLRVDFGFFIIRFDYSYKVKDPSPDINKAASQNKWFYDWKFFNGQFQLGIGYPFIL
jgi:outer membrane protein insertion porin family